MLLQLLVGGAVTIGTLTVHAILMASVARTVHRLSASDRLSNRPLQRSLILSVTGILLIVGHFLEVMMWALTYTLVGAAPPGTDTIYFAFGNYTTLGYGDVVPVDRWLLLGPMTALNGILLIGWSTAVTFEVLRRTAVEHAAR